jgi:RNA polymerase sigma factor (sigma-70 family)
MMEKRPARAGGNSLLPGLKGIQALQDALEREAPGLLRTLRVYVWRAGIATGPTLEEVAQEVLSEVVAEALEHADRFDAARQPRAWLLGIASNLIKRRQVARAVNSRREPVMGDLYADAHADERDGELFDRLSALVSPGPEEAVEANEQAARLLALVSPGDRRVLQLAILSDLDGEKLARALGTTPVAARVRRHRAMNRLRDAWLRQIRSKGEEP